MPAKTKTMTTKQDAQLRKAWERLDPEEREEVRRFIQFLESRASKTKVYPNPLAAGLMTEREPYVNPVQLVIDAAKAAEAMRHETYSIELLHRIAAHNETELVPALCKLLQWALDLQREINQIDAKLIARRKADMK